MKLSVLSGLAGLMACLGHCQGQSYAHEWVAIHQTLSRYPLAIDSKNFGDLDQVFAVNASANYSAPIGVLNGLATIEAVLEESLAPVISQHALTTQVIDIYSNGTANSTSYYTASQFGVGAYYGQVLYSYGQYLDHLVKTSAGWRIDFRQLLYMGPFIGNISVFSPQP